ncbi:uncharacterized protein TNCV_4659771 [Trichonephila clavipes]|uniref:Uncharacterized protein n=1 Tax=Trichonephila clavipes TaxID=2585209 RepID=A0A8X6VIR2_TRICX|nr:uncharacterized protein TNCV_4659771 [Trichonephila clavipes]
MEGESAPSGTYFIESNNVNDFSLQCQAFVSEGNPSLAPFGDFVITCEAYSEGCCSSPSPVVKVSDHGRHVMSSSPVPLKTRRVGKQCTLILSRAQTSSIWCGSYVRGMPAQVSASSLDHDSKLRGSSSKALV